MKNIYHHHEHISISGKYLIREHSVALHTFTGQSLISGELRHTYLIFVFTKVLINTSSANHQKLKAEK